MAVTLSSEGRNTWRIASGGYMGGDGPLDRPGVKLVLNMLFLRVSLILCVLRFKTSH